MVRATLKSLLAHKLRLALTSLAIVLGVGFVAGSLILTDTLDATFVRLFKQIDGGVDVRVRSFETFSEESRGGANSARRPVPEPLLEEVLAVPGVRGATGYIEGFAQMVDKEGDPIGGQGPPTLGVSVSTASPLDGATRALPQLSRLTVDRGRLPTAADQVAIDAETAAKHRFRVGDRIKLLLLGPAQEFEVVGIVKVGSADTLGGATIAAFDMATAHEVLNRPGTFDAIDVSSGVASQQEVRTRVDDALGQRYEVLTGEQLAAQEAKEVSDSFVKFLGIALLIFAGVALFVGTFIISNTFSIIVASRTRELALLRTLGARRRQVMASVLGEALVTGVVSSIVGVGFGILVASGLKAVFSAFGGTLPSSANVVTGQTVVVGLAVGVVVTLVSALLPAIRATRVPPLAALREEGMPVAGDVPRARVVVGVILGTLGLALLGVGLGQGKASIVGLGAAAFMVGVAVFSVVLARPLARVIGAPIARVFKLPGRLARDNAMRNPGRSSSTAAALMIGLALVTFVSVFADSVKASLAEALERSFAADYVVVGKGFEGFSPQLGRDLRSVPELDAVVTLAGGQWRLDGDTKELGATELSSFTQLFRLDVVDGRPPPDDGTGLMVEKDLAERNEWRVGDEVTMEFAQTGVQPVRVAAVFAPNELTPGYLLSAVDYDRNFSNRRALVVVARAAPGVVPAESRSAIEKVVEGYPNAEVKDQVQYRASVTSRVNQLLALITVLLLLAIVIAVIGIVNTLALSVIERTRELGLLRALGMSRRQVRRMVRWESVIIAVIGATLGLVVGVFFGWALVTSIRDQGITRLSIPVGQLVSYMLVAGIFGVVAALLPARRAARLDVLEAIAYE